jgi:hypothetical protein
MSKEYVLNKGLMIYLGTASGMILSHPGDSLEDAEDTPVPSTLECRLSTLNLCPT